MTRAHNFTRKQRAELALRAKGCCELCSMRLKAGEGDADHILPVELGGESDLANGQWICKPCHKAKTAKDVGMMRKAERQRDRHTGAMLKTRNPIKSAGFSPRQKQKNAASAPIQKWAAWRENSD
jgi:5-methylcytosine-specific restriction endonuclease McrA